MNNEQQNTAIQTVQERKLLESFYKFIHIFVFIITKMVYKHQNLIVLKSTL